jgi:L-lactate dehydrogenase complex protein LldG
MTSRDRILERVRAGTNNAPEYQRPPTPQVWPETRISQKQLLERFRSELHAVGGESFLCTSMIHGAQKLAELAEEHRWNKIGVADRPLCHALTARLPYHTLLFERSNWDPAEMAGLSVGLVAADAFLADTGSALIRCETKEQRLLCYIPPISIAVVETVQIAENLPSVWRTISDGLGQREGRGEYVIVTGPSRSSDIEKKLVLGVHGPQRVIALLV